MKNHSGHLVIEAHVNFDLNIDDNFPPISAEKLIGTLLSEGLFKIDNTPFFVEGISLGDIVKCTGFPPIVRFDFLYKPSKNKSVSVIFIENDYAEELYQIMKSRNCYCEYGEFPEFDMLAISIPPEANYGEIRSILENAEFYGKISFAELCIR